MHTVTLSAFKAQKKPHLKEFIDPEWVCTEDESVAEVLLSARGAVVVLDADILAGTHAEAVCLCVNTQHQHSSIRVTQE